MCPTITVFSPSGGFVAEQPAQRADAARVRPDHLRRDSRQRGDDRCPAERELRGLARAAVPAREHVAERELERAPGFADRARLSPARVVQIALSVAVGQRDAEAVLLGVVGLGMPKEDHVAAVSQAVDDLERAGRAGRFVSSTAAGERAEKREGEQRAHVAEHRARTRGYTALVALLDRVSIHGFRSARDVELAPQRICALVGEASGGKSTVLTAIWMLLESGAPVPNASDVTQGANSGRIRLEAFAGDKTFFLDARPPATLNLNREGAPPVVFLPTARVAAATSSPSPRTRGPRGRSS